MPLFVSRATHASEDLPNNLPKSILLRFHPVYLQMLQHIYVQSTGTYTWETDFIYCLLENHINESLNIYIRQIDMNTTYI